MNKYIRRDTKDKRNIIKEMLDAPHYLTRYAMLMLETHVQYLAEHVIDTHCISLYSVILLYADISL